MTVNIVARVGRVHVTFKDVTVSQRESNVKLYATNKISFPLYTLDLLFMTAQPSGISSALRSIYMHVMPNSCHACRM